MHLVFSPGLKIHLQPYCVYHQFWCYFQQNKRKPAGSGVVWAGPQRIPIGFRRHPGCSSSSNPGVFLLRVDQTSHMYMIYGGFLSHRDTPSHHPNFSRIWSYEPSILGYPHCWKSSYDSLSHSVRCHDQVWYPILIHQDFPCQRWYLLICGVFSPRIFWYPKMVGLEWNIRIKHGGFGGTTIYGNHPKFP